ncbi:GNAT family N-acetyltransferase [Alteribacter natronophilus]|uniref:GNAT family N-acetyltransferase n=1 Tax=Alteribacter natronophilus TaxID=2583810 RepID=UPI00110D6651|nr:GNAT family N-acetyltransferase [Alteribacter natronophilus]TMW71515.1 GNAT family N-acetyltransferase [Alteribacter natronophilus]
MAYIEPSTAWLRDGRPFTVRTAYPADAEDMRNLTRETIAEKDSGLLLTAEEFQLSVQDQAERIQNSFNSPWHTLAVARHEGKLAGVASFEPEQMLQKLRHHGLMGLIVAKEYRSLGVGRTLLTTLLKWAAEQPHLKKAGLEVISTNEPAISLYLSLGFQPAGRFHNHVHLGNARYADVYRMERPLRYDDNK